MIGKIFDRWEVLEFIIAPTRYQRYYKCRCSCGKEKEVGAYELRSGRSRSCGCLRAEQKRATGKYGKLIHEFEPEYAAWNALRRRCNSPVDPAYKDYGGRGICVCADWRNFFERFIKDMGKRPEGLSLDRIDNDGNYEPSNCRWATSKQQANNRRT